MRLSIIMEKLKLEGLSCLSRVGGLKGEMVVYPTKCLLYMFDIPVIALNGVVLELLLLIYLFLVVVAIPKVIAAANVLQNNFAQPA